MKDTKKNPKKLKEVNEQELRRVMGGAIGCGECLCGSGSGSTTSSFERESCAC